MKRTPLRKVSAKNWWIPLRRKLKVAFERASITTCELGYTGCWNDNALGFAHSLKRRNIATLEQRAEVILACNHCHDILKLSPENEMRYLVCRTIQKRVTSVIFP